MICNNTSEYLAFHTAVETEGSIFRRDTTDPFVRPRQAHINMWWIKQALKAAQRRGYWMNAARNRTHKSDRDNAVRMARSYNRDVLWAIRGARKYSGWAS